MAQIKFFIEYISLRFVVGIISIFPHRLGLAFGRIIGDVVAVLFRKRFHIARANLESAFPGISSEKVEGIIKGCWENLGMSLAEFSGMPEFTKEEYESLMCVKGLENLEKSYREGKGVLLITAHFGNWEVGSRLFPPLGFKSAVIVRRIKNPYVDDFVNRVRNTSGFRVIMARNGVRESIRWLKEGNMLVMLMDQRITDGGLQVPFFGRPAYTTSLPAILALRYSVPVHFGFAWREKGGEKINADISPAMDFSDIAGKGKEDEDIYNVTLRMNAVIEDWVRKYPEMWLWIHNRWKI